METIAIIPARSGSKRLPGKNTKIFCGKPLIAYSIIEAKKSKLIDGVIVTSDSDEILAIAEKYGAITIKRPDEFAQDSSRMIDTVKHVIEYLGYKAIIVLLQPTSPLRTVKDIDKCIRLYSTECFDSVISVKELSPHAFYPNGAVYVFTDKIWCHSMGLILMKDEESVDINTEIDFKTAEMIMNDRNKKRKTL